MKFTLMLVDDGHGGPAWGTGEAKPEITEAESIDALQNELDDETKPFKVDDGVWLLQAPPEIYVAVEKKAKGT